MLLAEALAERAAMQRRIDDLRGRIEHNATYFEGETPREDPGPMLMAMRSAIDDLGNLTTAINVANLRIQVRLSDSTVSMTRALALRDMLQLKLKCLLGIMKAATGDTDRRYYRRTSSAELVEHVADSLSISELRTEADGVALRLRQLNLVIQQANHTSELVSSE